jgi:hypothetical protein
MYLYSPWSANTMTLTQLCICTHQPSQTFEVMFRICNGKKLKYSYRISNGNAIVFCVKQHCAMKIQLYQWMSHCLVDRYRISVTNDHGYVPPVVNTFRSFPHSWLITGFVTRLTRRVSLVEQELLTLREHLSSHLLFSGVRVNDKWNISMVICDRYSITVNQAKLLKWCLEFAMGKS